MPARPVRLALLAATLALVPTPAGCGDGDGAEQAAAERWQCPMHPQVVMDGPGKCPICGMNLVRLDEAPRASHEDLGTVEITAERQQLIGLRLAEAGAGPVGGALRATGRVAVDEARVRHVNVKVAGYVERIWVDFVGKPVRKGDPLFSLYSPDLVSAQEELLLAIRTREALARAGGAPTGDGDALVEAARRRLRLWDVPEAEIDRVEEGGAPSRTLVLASPISGVVTKKDVVEGMKLDAGAMPLEVVDLGQLWFLADVYQNELGRVAVGLDATVTFQAFPGRVFDGEVGFIDPLLDPRTRTARVRLTLPNPGGELRPEMFGEAVLRIDPHDGLRIPADAVIDSGTARVVFVAAGEGRFQPREVRLGEGDGTWVEVLEGLAAGDKVVERANFLVDSESRLRASLQALGGGGAP